MAKTTLVADEDLTHLIDLHRLEAHLDSLGVPNLFVCIVCTTSRVWENADDFWKDEYINVTVQIAPDELWNSDTPFEVIKGKVDARLRSLKIAA